MYALPRYGLSVDCRRNWGLLRIATLNTSIQFAVFEMQSWAGKATAIEAVFDKFFAMFFNAVE